MKLKDKRGYRTTSSKKKKNGEYEEYKKIIKIIDNAYKKALLFKKTEFQKKLERTYDFC